MTITEAKKIIEMCADAVKKGDGDDAKIYVNKEYVLQILYMVESNTGGITTIPTCPGTCPGNDEINKAYPNWPPTWPQVWYKDSTDEPESPGPGFEKVPWWVWYRNGYEFTCDANSTGSKPQDADVVMTSADLTKFNEAHANPEDYKNVTISSESSEPTHLFKEKFTTAGPIKDELKRFRENQAKDTKTFDASSKRTDYIDDWAGGSTTGGGSFNHSMSSIIDDSSNTYCNC